MLQNVVRTSMHGATCVYVGGGGLISTRGENASKEETSAGRTVQCNRTACIYLHDGLRHCEMFGEQIPVP